MFSLLAHMVGKRASVLHVYPFRHSKATVCNALPFYACQYLVMDQQAWQVQPRPAEFQIVPNSLQRSRHLHQMAQMETLYGFI